MKERNYRAGSDAPCDKYVMFFHVHIATQMRKTIGESRRGKEATQLSATTKGILWSQTFKKKHRKNKPKMEKNPANSYTPTYSSYVAEVKKTKNLFTRWHNEA